jgi:minor extracellular serine protease Vpr
MLFATFPRALRAPRGERRGAGETMKGERLLKRTFFVPLVLLGAILLLGTAGAYGASKSGGGEAFESPTGAWFVELSTTPEAFNAKAKGEGLQFTERHRFTRLWKGVSVNATGETAQAMKRLDGVVSVHPVGAVTLAPVERTDTPELVHAIAMTGADVAQNELKLTGAGIQVGIMDTGIDYHNPALGECFGPGCRVFTGRDFVGDRFDSTGSGGALIPHPDGDPDDCNGHGTHVAGIVGANGTVNGVALKGVAPGVAFGAYKVFGCDGSTTEDIMVAAMEQAQADGMDVVNMSIGDAFAWDTEPFAQAMNAAVDQGTVVVISAGNSGTNGLYSLSSAGNASKVIGVASMDNSHVELPVFTVSPDATKIGYQQATAAGTAPTSGDASLARTGTKTSTSDACAPLAAGSLAGKVALIRRGGCTFYVKSINAQNAGAAGVVIYNNSPGRIGTISVDPAFGGVPGGAPITIPVVNIAGTEGELIDDRLVAGPVTMTWTDDTEVFPNATAGQPSSFTSWGLPPSLGHLKPDIAAPGGLIKSSWLMEEGGHTTISGTSMAAPHVSGAAALFLQEHGAVNPLDLREIFQNSADPALAGFLPGGIPVAQQAHRQGAGMIDIDDAIKATTRVSPAKLALGEGTAAQTKTLSITNNDSEPVTYTLFHDLAAGTTANTFAPALATNFATVTFSPSSMEVPAGGTRTVDVTVTPNSAAANVRRIYSGYIRLAASGKAPLRIPYAGFTGDYQSIVVLAQGACLFPDIFKAGGETTCGTGASAPKLTGFTRQADNATYNVGNRPDRPVLLWHMAHQAQRLEIKAVNARDQEFMVAFQDLFERNPTNDLAATGFFTYTWDGKAVFTNANGKSNRRALPSGSYRLRLVVTKAMAEPGNPDHIERWESRPMNIVSG